MVSHIFRVFTGGFSVLVSFFEIVLVPSESGSIVRCRGRKSAGVVFGGRSPKAFYVFWDPLGAIPHRGEHFSGPQILAKMDLGIPISSPTLYFIFDQTSIESSFAFSYLSPPGR